MTLRLSPSAARRLTFGMFCKFAGLPEPVSEHRFDTLRRWRFDWAFIDAKLAVEVDGGAWTGGRHTRGRGYKADIEKIAAAMCQGWVVLRVMPEHVESGEAVTWCEKILAWRQG